LAMLKHKQPNGRRQVGMASSFDEMKAELGPLVDKVWEYCAETALDCFNDAVRRDETTTIARMPPKPSACTWGWRWKVSVSPQAAVSRQRPCRREHPIRRRRIFL